MPSSVDVFTFCALTFLTGSILLAAIRRRGPAKEPRTSPSLQLRRDIALRIDRRTQSFSVRFEHWFENILIRAAIPLDETTCLLLIVCCSLTAGAITFAFDWPIWVSMVASVVSLLVGFAACFLIMVTRRNRFKKVFPASLELLARATRAGENLQEAFRIVSESCEEPVKGEFLQCVSQMEMGLSPASAARDLSGRIDVVDVHLLAHTIAIHEKLGGRLADSLERLSNVIRDRSQCEQKIRSTTSIGRFAVLAIVLMGLFVLGYMLTAQPDYIDNLFTSSLGHKLLAYAGVSEALGLIWVAMTLKSEL